MNHFSKNTDIEIEPIWVKEKTRYGEASKEGGEISLKSIKLAVELALNTKVDAIVTAPISKTALQLARSEQTDHTTLLKRLTNSANTSMAFYSETLKVILATVHVPLSKVPTLLTKDRLEKTIAHAELFCKWCGIKSPKIGLAGLNPHAGEDGLMGDDEFWIKEVSANVRENGVNISDPLPPDIIFRKAHHGEFDCVVALYHDQGLIPVKLLAFDTAVNVTVGLPFIRTSPDHGTAYDIAGKGIANPSSLIAAIECAHRMAKQYG